MPIALALALLLATPLPPGRYAGLSDAGRVDLTLAEDGRAVFGAAAMRWRVDGDGLVLSAPGGRSLRLTVRHEGGVAVLEGAPFGPLRLRPLPSIAPAEPPTPVRPLDWVGGWRHAASGGVLILRLRGDGRYAMLRSEADPTPGTGDWSAPDGALVLTPDGGPPLTYRARRDGPDLIIAGGDLPIEVRFVPDAPR